MLEERLIWRAYGLFDQTYDSKHFFFTKKFPFQISFIIKYPSHKQEMADRNSSQFYFCEKIIGDLQSGQVLLLLVENHL